MHSIKLSDEMQSIFARIINHDANIDRNNKVDLWVDSFGEDIINFNCNLKTDDNCNRIIRLQRRIHCKFDQNVEAKFKDVLLNSFPDMNYSYDVGILNLDLISEVFRDEDYYELIKGGLLSLDKAANKAIELIEK